MATSQEYTISRKVSDTEEEIIQIPYGALANKPDLSVYQTKNDASLATADKTVVGAINEVNSTAGTNKTDITNIKNGTSHVGVAKKVEWVFHLSKWDGKFTGTKDYDGSKAMRLGFNTASYFELGENASGLVNGYVVELKDTGVTAGTYNNVTVDSKGRVTAGESKDYALKRDIPAKVTSVDGLGGGTISGNVSTTGNLTVGGNLTVNGTTTTVDSTTLQVKDKLIEVAHGNTAALTTPAGLVAPKYDGTNSGALVFDSTGTAYVGDVTLKDGNIDVAKSGLQPLATRTGLVGGNLVQYDSTAQTLKDSGKKISDLATTSQVNAKYTKPNGGIPKTDLASDVQTSLVKADNALSLDGGTIKKSKTIKMDASANSDGANLKWGTVNSKNPYIGYASDQSDGTFVVGSLLGTNYASGLAIGGGSGNLLWKGTKVATTSDIPNDYVKYTAQTLTDAQKSQARSNIGAGTSNFDGTWDSLSGKPDIVQSTGTSTSSVMSQNATTNAISGKLDKTTYEVNKTIEFGRDGALYVGKFKVYDTNVTCEVTSTTDVTYSGKLVIATQNYVIRQMTVYGDAANTVAPNFFIKPSTTSDPYIEVYFKPASWSKNVVHIYGSRIEAEPTDVCTNVPSVPSTATLKPKNALPIFELSGTTLTITL